MEEQGIRFKVYVDDAGVAPSLSKAAQGFAQVGGAADKAGAQVQKFGTSGNTVNRFLQSLSLQSTDIAQQLASGQSPFTVLLQQGGQVVQQSGGLRATFGALVQTITPLRFAIGGAAAAAGVFATAAYQGWQETSTWTRMLGLNGQALGLTIGRIDALAQAAQRASGGSIGDAREAVLALAGSGSFAADSMDSATRAVAVLQRATGQSAEEIVRNLAGMRQGVAAWAIETNRRYNYISAAQVQYLRELEAQGRTQEAVRLNSEQLATVLENRLAPSLGLIERSLQAVKNAGSGAWDWLKSIGRDATLEEQLAEVQAQIAFIRTTPDVAGRKMLEQQQDNLRRTLAAQRQFAATESAQAASNQKEMEEQSRGHQSSLASIERAAAQKFYQERQAAIDARARQEEEAYQRFATSGEQYRQQLARTERERLDIEEKRARVDIFIERSRSVTANSDEALQRDAKLIELETRLVRIKSQRAELEGRIRNFQAAVPPAREVQESPQASFRQAELAQSEAIERGFVQRREAAAQFAAELSRGNQVLAADLIQDERERGMAIIALDEREIRARLDLAAMSANDRKRAEDDLARWRVLRERQLTEQLKPEFQRQRELWQGNFTANPALRTDFVAGMVSTGEEGFKAWVKEGESAIDRLASYVEDRFLSIFYKRFLQAPLENFANTAFDALGSFFTAGLFHTGGVVGSGAGSSRSVSALAFAGAPRYHTGGIAGDEVPAILRRGEEVLTANDPRHIKNGGGSGGDTIVLQAGGNNFGSDVSRPEIARYVDNRDRRLLAQVRELIARSK